MTEDSSESLHEATSVPASRADRCVLLAAEGITVRVRDKHLLRDTWYALREGEHWAILGPNGSGKSSLLRALLGLAPTSSGRVRLAFKEGTEAVGYVSAEQQELLLRREQLRSLQSGETQATLTPRALIDEAAGLEHARGIAAALGITHLLDRPIAGLSSGEFRRVLLVRALARRPKLLALDEPFDGLDAQARVALRQALAAAIGSGAHLLIVVHRAEELLPFITHALFLERGRICAQGPLQRVAQSEAFRRWSSVQTRCRARLHAARAPSGRPPRSEASANSAPPLVEMHDVMVRYGEHVVFSGLDWVVRPGEHWAVVGPNGSGKSSLLALLTGENPQVYANDVRIFGRRRGSGESLWEIRQRIGVVSLALQTSYDRALTVEEVVASGFYDSIGLYRVLGAQQRAAAADWLRRLGLGRLAGRPFDQLSYGERRLALVARAMVKSPALLALDEPCDGLDPYHRAAVLDLVDQIALRTDTSIVYVTHLADELPQSLARVLRLGPAGPSIEVRAPAEGLELEAASG